MRNATVADVKKAQETGKLEENVMYEFCGIKVHGKNVVRTLENAIKELSYKDCVIGETNCGAIMRVDVSNVCPISKGPAQQPKKPRRKPIKGTKPEQLIPMSADVKLKVGDRVLLKDGTRTTIRQVDNTGVPYQTSDYVWHRYNGECIDAQFGPMHTQHNITHKIVPWQEQRRLFWDGKFVGRVSDLNITLGEQKEKQIELKMSSPVKSPEQEAFEKGYWVPHQAKPDSVCPPFAAGWKVDYLMREMESGRPEYAENLRWNAKGNNADIVAFRKEKQQ